MLTEVDFSKVEWASWAAVAVAIFAAWWSWKSAKSSEKQNRVAIHGKMIEAYQDYMQAFQAALFPKNSDAEISEVSMRIKSATDVLEFYFKPIVYTDAKKSMDDFTKLWSAIIDLDTYNESLKSSDIEYEEQCTREAINGEKKKIRTLRKKLREDHEVCLIEIKNELRLHHPNTIFFLKAYVRKVKNRFWK